MSEIIKNPKIAPKLRPDPVVKGETEQIETGCGTLYITINEVDGDIFELFSRLGKSGGCAYSQTEGLTRMVSTMLRCNIDIDVIIKQLEKIRCPECNKPNLKVTSCSDAIAFSLKNWKERRGLA